MKRTLYWLPLTMLLVWLATALLSPLLTLHPYQMQLPEILAAPDSHHWFGFDDLGRPVFDRLILGARTSLLVAFSVMSVTLVIGCTIGVFSAWSGGWIDSAVMRICDVFLAFPGILLAISMAAVLGPGIENVIIALSVVGWVGFARLARAQTLQVQQREHVMAARALGTSSTRIVLQHLLPLIVAPIIVEATFTLSGLIIAEAGLSFLGLGVQAPEPSWGSMIRDGASYLLVAPHLVIFTGAALLSLVLAVNLLGDQLRDHLDVKN